jgi:hypothetical protein
MKHFVTKACSYFLDEHKILDFLYTQDDLVQEENKIPRRAIFQFSMKTDWLQKPVCRKNYLCDT